MSTNQPAVVLWPPAAAWDRTWRGVTAADVRVSRQTGLAKDRFENSEVLFVDWAVEAVIPYLREESWVTHGWLNLFNSAVAELHVSQADLHRVLGRADADLRRRHRGRTRLQG